MTEGELPPSVKRRQQTVKCEMLWPLIAFEGLQGGWEQESDHQVDKSGKLEVAHVDHSFSRITWRYLTRLQNCCNFLYGRRIR